MLKNPDFKGQLPMLFMAIILLILGAICIVKVYHGSQIVVPTSMSRGRIDTIWPWWIGYVMLITSFFLFYATFRVILQRLRQRIHENTVSKDMGIREFVIAICKCIFLFFAFIAAVGGLLFVRDFVLS